MRLCPRCLPTKNKKGPRTWPGAFFERALLNVRAVGDGVLGFRGRGRQLHAERERALVPKNAQLDGLVLVFALGGKLFAQLADGANTVAVERSDDVAGFDSRLFRS